MIFTMKLRSAYFSLRCCSRVISCFEVLFLVILNRYRGIQSEFLDNMVRHSQVCEKLDNSSSDVSFHKFPADSERRKIWASLLGWQENRLSKSSRSTLSRAKTMKIAIVGAGAGGLSALRHCLQKGHDCEVFEQTRNIGGTWRYAERTGRDEFGLPIHSSMYDGLRTNLPKELMGYDGFPYEAPRRSYLTQPEVLEYIEDFARAFELLPHIKFLTHVERVSPLPGSRWSISLLDLQTRKKTEKEFDAVLVCVGKCSVPFTPSIPGLEKFKGRVIHSHDYRKPGPYKGRKVLIIGSGPSGMDISRIVFDVADKVVLCHRSAINKKIKLPEGMIIKPEPKEFKETSVLLVDGSEETIDSVIFCTGYSCSYPFLTADCGIEVDKNWVKYTYKQVINVKNPTMGFIGLPIRIFPFVLFGIQVRFFLSYLDGNIAITEEQMLDDIARQMAKRAEQGVLSKHLQAHYLGLDQGDYMDDLAETAKVEKIPPVFIKLYKHVHTVTNGNRDLSYRIIDDEEFVQIEG